MKILITGSSGLVGQQLIETLLKDEKVTINTLSRGISSNQNEVENFHWDPNEGVIDERALEGVDVVINLAGEPIANQRWSLKKRERIISSRVNSTRLLISTIAKKRLKIKKFINASAIGIYGDRGEEIITEDSSFGTGFLSEVCKSWESEVKQVLGMDILILRIGVVLSSSGGMLSKMIPVFKKGLGGSLASGKQYISFIHIDDLVNIIIEGGKRSELCGVINAVSPNPVSNYDFSKQLSRSLKRPFLFKTSKIVLKIVMGEMAEIVLSSQRVNPQKLIDYKFKYKFKDLKSAFDDILNKRGET